MAKTATAKTKTAVKNEIKELITNGNKIQAIKLYREHLDTTGSLKASKDAVDAMEKQMAKRKTPVIRPVTKRVVPKKPLVGEQTQPQDTYFAQVLAVITENNPRAIHIVGLLKAKRKDETLQDFLTKFFTKWNLDRVTNYKDTGEEQTPAGRRRSLGDIYMICKYYFPDTTLRAVLHQLYNVLPRSITRGFRSSYCTTIKKRVWYYDAERGNEVYNQTQPDEFGNKVAFYLEGLSQSNG